MKSMNRCGAAAMACVLLGAATLGGGCTTNPTTGKSDLPLGLSRDEEVQVGLSEGPKLTQEFGGEVPNPNLRAYVNEVGQKLKSQTEADGPTRTWTFTLLESEVINAFALPGERVFMSRGLADKLTSEAQLAGVLGHEIGHVMARHTSNRIAQSRYVGIGAAVLGAVGGAVAKSDAIAQGIPAITNAGGEVLVLKFSRDQESEADSLGMRYMSKAGYNPRGQLEVMQVLKRESSAGNTPEILATHPLPDTRIDRVTQELSTTYASTQSGPQKGNYQDFTDQYRQRYLGLRSLEPRTAPKAKKRAEAPAAPVDEHGRTRWLATVSPMTAPAFVASDASTWCSVCRFNEAFAVR